ncbi:MAG: TIR domain-containing protein, partial [Myxococcota bacterium]
MYIHKLCIKNFKCFEDTEGTFTSPASPLADNLEHPNVNLILGNNGVGKSSLLQAAVLALLSGAIEQSGFVPRHLVRRGGPDSAIIQAEVYLEQQDLPRINVGDPTHLTERTRTQINQLGDVERLSSSSRGERPKVFISFAKQNQRQAHTLRDLLHNADIVDVAGPWNVQLGDDIRTTLDNLIVQSAVVVCLISPAYLASHRIARGEYYALILFSVVGMMVMVSAVDLFALFIGLEM